MARSGGQNGGGAVRRLAAAAIAGVAALLAAPGFAADEDGARLAQAVHDRPAGRDATTVSRMELTERGRAPRVRELVTYRLDRGGDAGTSNLVRFTAPEDIEGTALLGVAKGDGSVDQWLYLPALDRARRIAGDRKGGRFVGSDLYFEDLQERLPSKDRHRVIGRETVAGVAADVLESVPVDPTNSVYVKRLSWIDPSTFVVLRVDYFERTTDTPSKRFTALKQRKVQGIWTVTDSVVADLDSGHETRLVVQKVLYDRKLPERLFTTRALGDEQLESEFRP